MDKELDGTTVLQGLRGFFKENPELRFIHDRVNLEAALPRITSCINPFPAVRSRMTAIATHMPALYQQSLFSGWFCAVIGKRMGLVDDQIAQLFLAGFTHDVGMILLQPELRNKQGQFTAEEWRQVQAHPIIGQKILMAQEGIPREVIRAVLEHHERTDGSGYPLSKVGADLHPYGQIVAMSDTFYAAYRQHVQNGKGTLRNLMPILKMNSEVHFYKTYDVVITLMKNSGLSEGTTLTDATMVAAVKEVRDHNVGLSKQMDGFAKLTGMLPPTSEEREIRALLISVQQALKSVRGSGILDEGYLRWLEQLEKDKLVFGYRELEDVVLMLKETVYQFGRIGKMARSYVEFGKDAGLKKAIRQALSEIGLDTAG